LKHKEEEKKAKQKHHANLINNTTRRQPAGVMSFYKFPRDIKAATLSVFIPFYEEGKTFFMPLSTLSLG
jgi:hypothetical protein